MRNKHRHYCQHNKAHGIMSYTIYTNGDVEYRCEHKTCDFNIFVKKKKLTKK